MSTGTQIDVVMPQMGISVSEGTVTKWLKRVGDTVSLDDPLLEISTDKVDTEVPSPGEGVLAHILVEEGQTVEVGARLAVIAPAGGAPTPGDGGPPQAVEAPASPASAQPAPAERLAAPAPSPPVAAGAPAEHAGNGHTFVSPVVARIAAEHGVDPAAVPGTGQGGRVTKKDILAYIEAGAHAAPAPGPLEEPAAAAAPPPVAAPSPVAAPPPPSAAPPPPVAAPPEPTSEPPARPQPEATGALLPGEAAEPITAMRRAIAEHMRRSLDTSAHVTNVSEIDLTRVAELRRRLKPEFEKQGVNLTFLAFIARAVVETVADWPWMNAEMRDDHIVTRSHVNLGIAVSLEGGKGLIVPVIRNAQDMNLLGTARAIQDVARRAREKKLLPDDVQGGTITITNPGGFGTLFGTPIISQPQVANIGVYAIVKRPVVVTDNLGNDSIAIRQMMFLTVTYDHRLIDGAYAAQFARDVKTRLEGRDDAGS